MEDTTKLLNGDNTLFNTLKFEAVASLGLKAFKKQYPSSTSADYQTFIFGLRVGYVYGHLQGETDQMKANYHPQLDEMDEVWVDSFFQKERIIKPTPTTELNKGRYQY